MKGYLAFWPRLPHLASPSGRRLLSVSRCRGRVPGRTRVDEIVLALAESDELDRQTELGADREHDAATRRPVELGEHDPGHPDRLGELSRLHETVLPGGRVEHQQHLGHVAGRSVGDAAHLLEFLHEVGLRVHPAGGVREHEVRVAGRRVTDGVVDHRGRIRSVRPLDEVGPGAGGPGRELFARRGTEGVAGGDHHLFSTVGLPPRELADRRRLADAVHADEQPHARGMLTDNELAVVALEERHDRELAEGLDERLADPCHGLGRAASRS